MPGPFEQWYWSTPPITRTYMTLCFVTTLAVYLDVITPLQLYLNLESVYEDLELWRLVTNFLFFDSFSLNFVFHMYFVIRHCRMLEESSFRGRMADFIYMWLFGAVLLTLIDLAVYAASDLHELIPTQIMFLGPSLAFMIVYVWARRNPFMRMSFLGLFEFDAPYLPWVMMGFGMLLGQSPTHDLLGVFAGHLYYFLEDVYPATTGRRPLRTPSLLKRLCGEVRPRQAARAAQPVRMAARAPLGENEGVRRRNVDANNNDADRFNQEDNGNGVVFDQHDN